MTENKILTFLEHVGERKINSKKFNEIFNIDGIPLWYLLEGLIKSDFFAMFFPILPKIESEMENDIHQTLVNKLKFRLLVFLLPKLLLINEMLKFWLSKPRKNFERRKVLFLGYTTQIPKSKRRKIQSIGFEIGSENVINALKKTGIKPLVLVCNPLSKNSWFGLRRYDYLLYSYVDPEIIKDSNKIAVSLNKKWKQIDEKDKIKLFTFHRKNYWEFLKNEINFLFSQGMLSLLSRYYFTFKKIIKSHDIQIIYLTGLTGFYESCLLAATYKLNKKIIFAPYGYGGSRRIDLINRELRKKIAVIVAGKEEEKILTRLGIKRRNIFSTGSPFFDKITKYKKNTKHRKIRLINTITLLTQPLPELGFIKKVEYFGYIRKFLVEVGKLKNIEIIIKLHPEEKNKSEYKSIIRSLKLLNVKLVQGAEKDSLYSVLSCSDVVISFGSTADIESLLLDKNVIVIEGFEGEWMMRQPYKKAVLQVKKEDDLANVIIRALTDKKLQRKLKLRREKYLRKSYREVDGNAHKRVANLIYRLCKNK